MKQTNIIPVTFKIKNSLDTNKITKLGEILFLFLVAFSIIEILSPFAGDNLIMKQAIVWLANIAMLLIVWSGLKIRGEDWSYFGLTFKSISVKDGFKTFLQSLLVFILAVTGFIIGSIIMANITGIPEGSADMSSYEYMQNNLPMFLITLLGVLIVSSFGEEVVYRGFLINRLIELGLKKKHGKVVTVIISSVIFGLVHYDWGPMGVVQTGFMGLALAICYLKMKKRLWVIVIAHAYMDTLLMVQMYLNNN